MSSPTKESYCFSFTAPSISDAERKLEFTNLPIDEQEQYEAEMNGTAPILRETAEFVELVTAEFQRALDAIPQAAKTDYLQALEQAPEVVAQEAAPLKFLRADRYNAAAAANRMVAYWKMRVALFPEQAFSPLTWDSLDDEDRAFWKEQRSLIPLPRDQYGRHVLYADRAKWTRAFQKSTLRCLFYIFHKLSMSVTTQKQGIVTLADIRRLNLESFDRKASRRFITMVKDCVPVRLASQLTCVSSWISPARLILPAVMWMMGTDMRFRTRFIYGSNSELVWDLKQVGIFAEGLPKAIGGDRSDDEDDPLLED